MTRNHWLLVLLCCLLATLSAAAKDTCRFVRIEAERLPDLHVPRVGHSIFVVNGEVTVTGGHTLGFVPTPTLEYYQDGEWHLLNTVYPHDDGMSIVLHSGEVLLMGGHSESLGIGQTFTVERYLPKTHAFEGFGCLDKKRVLGSAVELDSGRVYITGNWYHKDAIEVFDGEKQFSHVKDVSAGHCRPFIFRTANDDALIIGEHDCYGSKIDSSMVDRLKGEPFRIPLLYKWHLVSLDVHNYQTTDCFIGDEKKGDYRYLLCLRDSSGQVAAATLHHDNITLLPTTCPIPMVSQWGRINWSLLFVVDKKVGRGYMTGYSSDQRMYVLSVDYTRQPAPLTVFYTDTLSRFPSSQPVLTADGNLVVAGGSHFYNGDTFSSDNYHPVSTAYRLVLRPEGASQSGLPLWTWLFGTALLLAIACWVAWLFLRRRAVRQAGGADDVERDPALDEELMGRICELLEREELYLDSNLRITDVANMLGSNRHYVSVCINAQRNCSFTQFINNYRIDYAQRLLRDNPEKKVSTVFAEVGFSNDTTFFRAFKAVTGKTPTEWRAEIY